MNHLGWDWIGVAVSIIALELVWVALVLRRQRCRRGAEPLGPKAFQRELKRICQLRHRKQQTVLDHGLHHDEKRSPLPKAPMLDVVTP